MNQRIIKRLAILFGVAGAVAGGITAITTGDAFDFLVFIPLGFVIPFGLVYGVYWLLKSGDIVK